MLLDGDCGRTSLVSKILSQLGEMVKMSQHKVDYSYHRNMSSILKLSSKCKVSFMLTGNLYHVIHQSIPSANTPGQTPVNFFEAVKSPVPGKNFSAKARPPGQENTYPPGSILKDLVSFSY